MENKFNRLDEVSFNVKGHKIHGIVKSLRQVVFENDITFTYEVFLIRQLTIGAATIKEMEIFENDLTLEKIPTSQAQQSNVPIVI